MFADRPPKLIEPTLEVKGTLQIYRSGDYTHREFLLALSCSVLNCQPLTEYGLSPKDMSALLAAHNSVTKKDVAEAVEALVEWCDLNGIKILDETSKARAI